MLNEPVVTTFKVRCKLPVTLWLLGDTQLGHVAAREDKLEEWVAEAKREKWRLVLMGDYIENVVPVGRLAVVAGHEQHGAPGVPHVNDQLGRFLDYIEGFTIDGVLCGNHDARSLAGGFDPARWLADSLHTNYLADGGYITWQDGRTKATGFFHHGEGPVVAFETLFDRLERDYPDADFYAAGHDHRAAIVPVEKWGRDGGTKQVWRMRTGSILGAARYQVRRPMYARRPASSVVVTIAEDGTIHPRILL